MYIYVCMYAHQVCQHYVRPLGCFVRIRIQFHVCTVCYLWSAHYLQPSAYCFCIPYQERNPIHSHLRTRLKTVFTMVCMNDDDQITTINRLNRNNKMKLFWNIRLPYHFYLNITTHHYYFTLTTLLNMFCSLEWSKCLCGKSKVSTVITVSSIHIINYIPVHVWGVCVCVCVRLCVCLRARASAFVCACVSAAGGPRPRLRPLLGQADPRPPRFRWKLVEW